MEVSMNIFKYLIGIIIVFSFSFYACSGGGNGSLIIHNGGAYQTVISPYTGRVWLDRNLGAIRPCITLDDMACYGDYYQWGRGYDGHQNKSSDTNATLAVEINNAGEDFIITSTTPYDWADINASDNDGSLRSFNWSKIDGDSVCPVEYRIPTLSELRAETLDNNASDPFSNNIDAFNNFLKIPSAMKRSNIDGDINYFNSEVCLWVNSVDYNQSFYMNATAAHADINSTYRAYGYSVRCIRDY